LSLFSPSTCLFLVCVHSHMFFNGMKMKRSHEAKFFHP
jgi:hypothetical protein